MMIDCWQQDSTQRPSFKQIFERFETDIIPAYLGRNLTENGRRDSDFVAVAIGDYATVLSGTELTPTTSTESQVPSHMYTIQHN